MSIGNISQLPSMVAAFGQAIERTIGGEKFRYQPLSAADFIGAANALRAHWQDGFLMATKDARQLLLPAEVRSAAMIGLQTKPLDIGDLLRDSYSLGYLAYAACCKAGLSTSYETFVTKPVSTINQLAAEVLIDSGVMERKADENPGNPTAPQTAP